MSRVVDTKRPRAKGPPLASATRVAVPRFRTPSIRRLLSGLALFLCFAGPGLAHDHSQEDTIKAAVVFKLTRYVDWPQDDGGRSDVLRLCVIGDAPITHALETVDGRVSRGLTVEYVPLASPASNGSCQVLFVADREAEVWAFTGGSVAGGGIPKGVLTVSDVAGFADRGGIVELIRRGTRLGFRVNVDNARSAGLTVSAPLLELAEIVQ